MPSSQQYPAFLAGQVLTAALLQALSPVRSWKLGDTARASSASLAADPDLVVALAANATYHFEGFLVFTGSTLGSSDLQIQVNAPSGASTFWWSAKGKDNATLAPVLGSAQSSGNVALGTNGTGNTREAEFKGTVTTSGAGNLSLLWAQATSNSTATTMKAGSWMKAERAA